MAILNAIVYQEDGKYYAECYEIAQIGVGDTKELAELDMMTGILNLKALSSKGEASFLNAGKASRRCRVVLENIITSDTDSQPRVRKEENIEVHFYDESPDK